MRREAGQAFILILIILGVGAALIIPLLQTVDTVVMNRPMYGEFIMEDYAADAAIEYGMWRLKHEPGFAESLEMGAESEPFFVTLNGVTANATIMAQTLEFELSEQPLGGPAEGEIFFKVDKTVVATATYATLVADNFEDFPCGDGSCGTGNWSDYWNLSGDYDFSTQEHEGTWCLLLRGDGNETPGDGYAERELDLSGSTGEGPYLTFWARIDDLEDWANDTVEVKVSINGVDWNVLETFTEEDNDYTYSQHWYDLSGYGAPPTFYIAFEVSGDHDSDRLYLDDLKFTNTAEITEILPGEEILYTYYVTMQCVDPDGCSLDRIVDELPMRGASSGDYLQYVDDSTDWDVVSFDSFAFDGFESSGDTGPWYADWTLTGACSETTYGEFEGQRCLMLQGAGGTGDGYAQRAVDLSGTTGSGPYLYFWSRFYGSEQGETVEVKASTDGESWDPLDTFDYYDRSSQYSQHYYDLSDYGRPSVLYVSFRINGNHSSDTFLVDAVEFSGYQGATSGEWPVPPFDPTYTETHDPWSSDCYQELEWDFEDKGYYDIVFDYGETRTFSFQAEAALTVGTYCNKIWVSNQDRDWWGDGEGPIVSGTTAKIIVGYPVETNCDGGKLEVNKTSDPEIVYPYEPTTVTYTITIENVDTVPIRIYEVEDWLPATGSDLQEEGFIYVDGSASGRIFNRESYPVLFYDTFNRGHTYTVTGWTEEEGQYNYCEIDYNDFAELRMEGAITKSSINTDGYTDIVLSYSWEGDGTEFDDKLRVEWKTSDNVTWNLLDEHDLDEHYWHDESWELPDEADDTWIDIRFTGNTDSSYEEARLDNVQIRTDNPVSYTPVCMPDDNEGCGYHCQGCFLCEDWEDDGLYPPNRWSITWDFSDYPDEDDYVWDPGQFCAGYPFVDFADDGYLLLEPGQIFEITFQAEGTLTYSGSYFNEVFVKIYDGWGWGNDDWIYSWPTGTVIVPQYDLQAETLQSVLRANALLSPEGHWWRSYHWWSRR